MLLPIFQYILYVGAGKTMLMDLFYSSARVAKKQRVHFNAFMLDVHNRKLNTYSRISTSTCPSVKCSKAHIQWTLTNPNGLGPEPIQISEMFGLVKCMVSIECTTRGHPNYPEVMYEKEKSVVVWDLNPDHAYALSIILYQGILSYSWQCYYHFQTQSCLLDKK